MDKKNIVGSFIGLEKSHVKSHITTSKLGKMSRVKDYDNKKIKKEIKSDLAREERLLKHISSDDFLYKTVIPYNKDIVALDEKIKQANKDLEIAKEFYSPLNEEKYKTKKEEIERRKLIDIEDETKRYNKDVSSSTIPGVKERLKEFQAFENIINVPLNAPIGSEEGSSTIDTLIMRPEELSPSELHELIDLHTFAKNELKSKIESLNPIYRDVFALYTGLHSESPLTKDNLWGELATYKDIIKYLDEKHKFLVKNPGKVAEWITNKKVVKEERKLYLNSKYKNDINFRLGTNLRNRLRRLLKKEKSSKIAIKNLGCTIEELKNHLGSQFLPGMTWMNHGIFGWHIDHIIPLSYFDLTIEEHIKKACHYTNLQPLWSIDNIKKGGIKNVKIKSIN